MEGDLMKKVDESWKEQAKSDFDKNVPNASQKEPVPKGPQDHVADMPPADFLSFVTTLGMQAASLLGLVPNPEIGKAEKDLPQAKYLIDTLAMLEEKTKNNLSESEAKTLEQLLYDLRMQYVKASGS